MSYHTKLPEIIDYYNSDDLYLMTFCERSKIIEYTTSEQELGYKPNILFKELNVGNSHGGQFRNIAVPRESLIEGIYTLITTCLLGCWGLISCAFHLKLAFICY